MRRLDERKDDASALPTVRLYRQDLDEILKSVASHAAKGQVAIRHDGYEFESLDELQKERGDEISNLRLDGGYVSVSFISRWSDRYVEVSAGSDPHEDIARIRQILRERQRWLGRVNHLASVLVSLIGLILFMVVVIVSLLTDTFSVGTFIGLAVSGAATSFCVWCRPKSRLILVRLRAPRHRDQSFRRIVITRSTPS